MDNEDTKVTRVARGTIDPGHGPTDPFVRAILEHEKATDSLGLAIRSRDPELVAAAADAAFSFFLTALALFHRLEIGEHSCNDRLRIGTAWYTVSTHHRAFADLLSRAQSELASPELHRQLEQHRISLGLAMDGLGPRPDNDKDCQAADHATSGKPTSGAAT